MFKKFTKADAVMLSLAFVCLIYSETLFFLGDTKEALFIGLWVPTILAFGIYLKLMKISQK
jgi:hypothetical protein